MPDEHRASRVAVVIPTYNERENLPVMVERMLALGDRYHLLIVDDNSPDGTGRIADDLAARHAARIAVLHRAGKAGLGTAYIAGFRQLLGGDPSPDDLIATMDADLSHLPEQLPSLIAATDRADLVLGSRYVAGGNTEGWPFQRRLLSRMGGTYARVVLGVNLHDLTGGFKVYRAPMLARLDLDRLRADGYGFQIETTWQVLRRGGRVVEVPITFADRVAGKSKLSRHIVIEAALMVWRLRLEQIAAGLRARRRRATAS